MQQLDFSSVLINKMNGMSFRDHFLQYSNHFGRDSGFLAVVRYIPFMFVSKKRGSVVAALQGPALRMADPPRAVYLWELAPC